MEFGPTEFSVSDRFKVGCKRWITLLELSLSREVLFGKIEMSINHNSEFSVSDRYVANSS